MWQLHNSWLDLANYARYSRISMENPLKTAAFGMERGVTPCHRFAGAAGLAQVREAQGILCGEYSMGRYLEDGR